MKKLILLSIWIGYFSNLQLSEQSPVRYVVEASSINNFNVREVVNRWNYELQVHWISEIIISTFETFEEINISNI